MVLDPSVHRGTGRDLADPEMFGMAVEKAADFGNTPVPPLKLCCCPVSQVLPFVGAGNRQIPQIHSVICTCTYPIRNHDPTRWGAILSIHYTY